MTLAHPGTPPAPHDLWTSWTPDPLVLGMLFLAFWGYLAGRHHGYDRGTASRCRDLCFTAALLTLALALLPPLDLAADALASAHMVQHLLLMLVAAPLLAYASPGRATWRAVPATARRTIARYRARLRLTRHHLRVLYHPGAAFLIQLTVLWTWHAAVPYTAALRNPAIHLAQHATFLLAAMLFWRAVIDIVRTGRTSPGLGILLVFGTAMHNVFLSALLTFAGTPWYEPYTQTAPAWNLDALADQHLAGVIMWVPGGIAYVATAMVLVVTWVTRSDHQRPARQPAHAAEPSSLGL